MKSFKKRIEQMKGITLVGLVITIILLLILAGVAINLAIGEKGIFNQSKLAAEKYKDAQNNEEEQLQIAANAMLGTISGNRDENGNSSISNNYSTNEQVVGTWIDGKPLYRKVFSVSFKATTNDRTSYEIEDLSTYNIDQFISSDGYWNHIDTAKPYNLADGSCYQYITYLKTDKKLKILSANLKDIQQNGYIIIRYTKTTDTVSSATE